MAGLSQINIPSLKKLYSGKVRDTFAVGDDKLLIVASDRISAFDVILGDPIPGKGKVLTSLTDFWFKQLEGVCPNHLTGIDPESVVKPEEVPMVKGRSCVAMRLKPILIECVARGYLIGGGWKDYCATGCVCGIKLPEGLQMGQKLPEPIFTPAAKAEVGTHDENILVRTRRRALRRGNRREASAATRSSSIAAPPNTPPRRASSSPTRSSSSALTRKAPSA